MKKNNEKIISIKRLSEVLNIFKKDNIDIKTIYRLNLRTKQYDFTNLPTDSIYKFKSINLQDSTSDTLLEIYKADDSSLNSFSTVSFGVFSNGAIYPIPALFISTSISPASFTAHLILF